ncbi:MAG: GNAT family N-acetyltransferase [Deinococcales bacterium]
MYIGVPLRGGIAVYRHRLETHPNDPPQIPENMIAQMQHLPPIIALELWHGNIPEQDLVAFAELTQVMNSAPKSDLEIEDINITPELIRQNEALQKAGNRDTLTAVVRHKSGELVGLNELGWTRNRASIVNQGATGVKPEHRNHGLGRWLKAANIKRLLELNPEARFIRTGNADSNAPMLKINHQMGFKPYTANIEWQGDIATILSKVQ